MKNFKIPIFLAVDCDPSGCETTIGFPKNGPCKFYNVPPEIYSGLINAVSPGWYSHSYIEGRYR